MGSGIFFPLCALPIIIIIIISFNTKKHIQNSETKIYNYLITTNLIGLVIELLCSTACRYYTVYPLISFFVLKTYLIYLIGWTATFAIYVLRITLTKWKNIYKNIHWSILIILFIIIYSLPIDVVASNNYEVFYTTGVGVNFSYLISGVYVIEIFIILISNIKKLKDKKYLPVFIFFIIGTAAILIQRINPQILLLTYSQTVICLIMYFTIENPDMKMLDEVHRAKEITDNANEEKAMFLYNMTNEIRDITKDIDHSADAILNETDNKKINIENVNDNARDIKASAARFTTMTNEILDVSSIDSANIKIYNDKYNIKLIIKELVQIYKSKAEKKGLQFRTTIASDLPEYLYGDSVGVKTVLTTILNNSIKFTENGYVEFTVNAIMKNNIARLIISVEDSGIGMKADELDKIFNKKEEDNESTNLNSNLNNAKKLITLMGGTIIPSSIYGKGTIIKVVLDQKVGETTDNLDKYEKILDKKKILLVDDNESSIKMITKLLKDSNIILDSVSTGKECLDKIRNKEKYDLILLDEKMKPLDGITVLKKLKEIRNFNTNVILLTRNSEYEYNEEYLIYGFKD